MGEAEARTIELIVSHESAPPFFLSVKLLKAMDDIGVVMTPFVSPQITLTADELFVHKICVTYDIETILGRFGTSRGPNLPSIVSIS